MSNNVFYVDGQFIAQDGATLPITDLAILRGYGVFDFMRTYGGKPFMLEEHLARLQRSAGLIDLPVPWSNDELKQIVLETVARNPHLDEANVRIVITGGESPNFLIPEDKPRLLVLVTPSIQIPQHYYTHGVKAITEVAARYVPEAKTINYIQAVRAMRRAKAQDAAEVLYISADGLALEGTTTNVFGVYGQTLVTPKDGILTGITRKVVLRLLRENGYTVDERALPLQELLRADEVFITASNKQVMPVIQIDDTRIGDGQPGAVTQQVMALYKAYTHAAAWA